jgi:DNA-binding transcriptional MerR regulator
MRIGDVIQETGLTRKALYYYEEKGLVSPIHDGENNYRDYGEHDVRKLQTIAVLRQLGLPMSSIRTALDSGSETRKILADHISDMDRRIADLENRRQLVETCLESESESLHGMLHSISKTLDLDARGRESYMRLQIFKLFPGPFGKILHALFSPFLHGSLDTPEKVKAWFELIQKLDELDPIDIPADVQNALSLQGTMCEPGDVWDLLYADEILECGISQVQAADVVSSAHELVRTGGAFLKPFFQYLEILSDDFREIQARLLKLNVRISQ